MSTSRPVWAADAPERVLVVDGEPTAVGTWLARTRKQRNTGLLGTDGLDGALWIKACNWVHTFGMRYALDLVYVGRHGRVVAVTTAPPRRLCLPRLNAHATIEMPAGLAAQLNIMSGTIIDTTPRI
ncbi:DUF192 domain-containing protein [Actinomyces ruminicola]|uniref:DUF192 domain-containing protein n=1 Tax=Actinomyces ruminicola TaxID=332524 RepID=A0A1G9YMR7_9ACTO|nr:DUF192 domain-containing protein [Actinomyces ruminicola]SDN10519.1 hypothetical protein SAMN04487766_11374 [Actinomyces ruminicola]